MSDFLIARSALFPALLRPPNNDGDPHAEGVNELAVEEAQMMSRTRLVVFIAVVSLAICQSAVAQNYPGGGTGTGGTTGGATAGMPGYTPPSGGYKANPALIGGLIGGGAAAGAGLWYFMHHRNMMRGCVGDDGKTLIREKDGQSFQLSEKLQPGERVALKTKKDSDSSMLQVEDIAKDYGRCEAPASGK